MSDQVDPRVDLVARTLHVFHGPGYCTMGKHIGNMNFYCYDEARVILAALDGKNEPGPFPARKAALTLSARQQRARR